jgi:hypothetical protein
MVFRLRKSRGIHSSYFPPLGFVLFYVSLCEDIEGYLNQMIKIVNEKGRAVDRIEIAKLLYYLRQIGLKEMKFRNGTELMHRYIHYYKKLYRDKIHELERYLTQTIDRKIRHVVKQELKYCVHFLQALDLMQRNEHKIQEFLQSFNQLAVKVVQKLKKNNPNEALVHLKQACNILQGMKAIFKKQKEVERYFANITR